MTTPSFFKIVLSTEPPRLRLPRKFVNKHKESIPRDRVVSVAGRYGPTFQVELTPSEGEIWLDKGLEKFIDYYSIQEGYLLIFKCDFKSSFFHVTTIFDQGATEIEYPLTSFKSCLQKEVISGECEGSKLEGVDVEVSAHLMVMNDISRERETENLEEATQALKPDELTAYERAKSFISTTRPSLLRFMHPSYISSDLSMSKRFALELMKGKKECAVVLTVPGGTRTWTANCRIDTWNAKLRWRTFVKDNELCVGDACVFELANGLTPSLNVIIFRSCEDEEVKGNLGNTNPGNDDDGGGDDDDAEGDDDDDDASIEILENILTWEDISSKRKAYKRKKLEDVEVESEEAKETTKKEMMKALENKEHAAKVTKLN